MGWEKWAVLAAGAVLAVPTGGASLAIAAPIAAALDQKDAIKKAEGQQQAATNSAQASIDKGYANATAGLGPATQGIQTATTQAQNAMAPYQQLGGQAANGLSNLMGFGGLSAPPVSSGAAPESSGVPMAAMAAPATAPSGELGGHTGLSSFVTDDNATRDMPPSLARAISIRSQQNSSYAGPNVQGPDGKFYTVPADKIEEALANGGTMLPRGRA